MSVLRQRGDSIAPSHSRLQFAAVRSRLAAALCGPKTLAMSGVASLEETMEHTEGVNSHLNSVADEGGHGRSIA
jgi:hypothetical protein